MTYARRVVVWRIWSNWRRKQEWKRKTDAMIIPWEPFLSLLIESVVCGDGNTQHQYLHPSLIDLHAYIILGTARPCPSYCECNLLFRFLQCQPWLLPFPADTRTPAGLSIRPLLTKGTRPRSSGLPGHTTAVPAKVCFPAPPPYPSTTINL